MKKLFALPALLLLAAMTKPEPQLEADAACVLAKVTAENKQKIAITTEGGDPKALIGQAFVAMSEPASQCMAEWKWDEARKDKATQLAFATTLRQSYVALLSKHSFNVDVVDRWFDGLPDRVKLTIMTPQMPREETEKHVMQLIGLIDKTQPNKLESVVVARALGGYVASLMVLERASRGLAIGGEV